MLPNRVPRGIFSPKLGRTPPNFLRKMALTGIGGRGWWERSGDVIARIKRFSFLSQPFFNKTSGVRGNDSLSITARRRRQLEYIYLKNPFLQKSVSVRIFGGVRGPRGCPMSSNHATWNTGLMPKLERS